MVMGVAFAKVISTIALCPLLIAKKENSEGCTYKKASVAEVFTHTRTFFSYMLICISRKRRASGVQGSLRSCVKYIFENLLK